MTKWTELDVRDYPAPSGSDELILADHGRVRAIYVSVSGRVAVAEFAGYAQLIFGYPNDEAGSSVFPGVSYGFFECSDTNWSDEITRQNRMSFAESEFKRRHFLACFHETTLQVLAKGLRVITFESDYSDVARALFKSHLDFEPSGTVLPRSSGDEFASSELNERFPEYFAELGISAAYSIGIDT